jgi:hypothetical protein
VLISRAALESVGRPLAPGVALETYALKGKGTRLDAAALFPGATVFL